VNYSNILLQCQRRER